VKRQPVGVVGLGIMGSAMAANLAKNGFRVYGYDVLAARRAALKNAGGVTCSSVAEVASKAKVIITSLPSAEALQKVSRQLKGIVIETSTLPIAEKAKAKELLQNRKSVLLDCPLSGTGAQARTGDLVVYGSGDKASFQRTIPILKGFSRAQYYTGEFGNGSRMKFVANLMVAIHNVSAGEAFALGIKAGLSPRAIYEVQANSAGASRMFQVRGPMMVKNDYTGVTMSNRLWQKDLKIIGEFAAGLGVATPLFNASLAVYAAALSQGFAEQDTGAVCAVLENMAGIKRNKQRSKRG
jgi:3-hydroxyisobutyrate dehydrogenase-like beta-hydroxyacid dehydrogenase